MSRNDHHSKTKTQNAGGLNLGQIGKGDLYSTITDQIIAAIEAGVKSGGPLWSGQGAGGMPFNAKSRRPYSGVNVLVLWLTAQAKGYGSPAWLTFMQAAELGGTVRKGEKAAHIVYYDTVEKADAETGEITKSGFLRGYAVFNVEQCEGLPAVLVPERYGFEGIEAADRIMRASGAVIQEGGARAFYSLKHDSVTLPDRDRFPKPESFYAVAMHELTHWTGHTSRLARDFSGRFGDESYAMEELVAEIGAAFICADLGLVAETLADHASYVDSWLRVLKRDKRAIFTAASQASKAHGWLMHAAADERREAA